MSTTEKELHIDIPVKLSDVKVVFSIASLLFEEICQRASSIFSSS